MSDEMKTSSLCVDLQFSPAGFAPLVTEMVQEIRRRTDTTPIIGIVLGSGLGILADMVRDPVVVAFADLPGLPGATAPGHQGRLIFGHIGSTPVLIQQGRLHLYEGVSASRIGLQVALHKALGVKCLILTNAAGSVNPAYRAGTLMAITDHINLTGASPLLGQNDLNLGPRCPDMTAAWSQNLRARLIQSAEVSGVMLEQGVYAGLAGPSFETPAEIRMLRIMGADAVGMSTVTEAIAARWLGLEICGISMITNAGAGYGDEPLTHQSHMRAAELSAPNIARIIAEFAREYSSRENN